MQDRKTITTTTIRLPAVRAEQLRALATARGVTITSLIEGVIHDAIAQGEIPADLPGVALMPTSGPTVAELLAGKDPAALAGLVNHARAGAHETIQKWRDAISAVSRRGAGFVVVSPVTGEEMVMSQSIFTDLKAQVGRAAAA